MKIEVNGITYERFLRANVETRLDALSSSFSFAATAQDGVPLPFKGGEACVITVDGVKVMDGFIELVNVDGDDKSHTIQISGRDKTGDLIDSTLGNISTIRAPISLKRIIEIVLDHLGITNIEVIDNAKPALFSKVEDVAVPEPGDNAFTFLEGYARKRQVLLTSNSDGNIVINSPNSLKIDASVLNRIGNTKEFVNANNVISYSVSYDLTGRFNRYLMYSQANPIAAQLAGTIGSAGIVNQKSQAIDKLIRAGRQFALTAETMSSSTEQNKRVNWEANVRRARGRVYSAKVAGFRNQLDELWTKDRLITVVDDFADISAPMLLNSVQYDQSLDEGSFTLLGFVDEDAYKIALAEPVATKKIGNDFLA